MYNYTIDGNVNNMVYTARSRIFFFSFFFIIRTYKVSLPPSLFFYFFSFLFFFFSPLPFFSTHSPRFIAHKSRV